MDDMNDVSISYPSHTLYPHSIHRGLCVPPFCPPESYSAVETLSSRPDDILIATYTKSGTTWLQTMVYHLLDCPDGPLTEITQQIPWLQSLLHKPEKRDYIEKMPSPRVFKTHDLFSWLPPQWSSGKIIYCVRNPKDWAVSYYHHIGTFNFRYKCTPITEGDFNQYFSKIARDPKVTYYGLWEDHVIEWLNEAAKCDNILVLSYEDLVEDCEREVRKIAHFLGVEMTPERLERVLHEGNIDTMKGNSAVNYSAHCDVNSTPFIRKGGVGGWKEWFNEDQSKEMDKAIEVVEKKTGVKIRTIVA